jgi:hypothetical protein
MSSAFTRRPSHAIAVMLQQMGNILLASAKISSPVSSVTNAPENHDVAP